MKTLANLKRELKTGRRLILKTRHGKEINEGREITRTQSNGVCIRTDSDKKSWLQYPKASLLEFDGATIRIYDKGGRPLTALEKSIRDNAPKDDEQARIDIMTDGSTMFWRGVRYYAERGALYLMGNRAQRGMRYDYNTGEVWDDKVKGVVVLEYVLTD